MRKRSIQIAVALLLLVVVAIAVINIYSEFQKSIPCAITILLTWVSFFVQSKFERNKNRTIKGSLEYFQALEKHRVVSISSFSLWAFSAIYCSATSISHYGFYSLIISFITYRDVKKFLKEDDNDDWMKGLGKKLGSKIKNSVKISVPAVSGDFS